MEDAYDSDSPRGRLYARVAEPDAEYGEVTAANLAKVVKELEQKMFQHAELLEFEEAANVRDRIHKLKEQALI